MLITTAVNVLSAFFAIGAAAFLVARHQLLRLDAGLADHLA
jgi:hypothetical protein